MNHRQLAEMQDGGRRARPSRSREVMQRRIAIILISLVSLAASATAPARADGSLSFSVGPAIMFQSAARQIGGTTQLNVGAGYDFGGVKPLPFRSSVVFDYASGSANGGSLTDWGLGLGGRLTTPTYLGASAFLYNVNANQGPIIGSRSATGFGSNIFVGEKLISIPGGASIGAQVTYRQLPTVNGIDASGLGFALRASL